MSETAMLTKAEAEMVYSAMCALNNVGGKLAANLESVRVIETKQGVTISDNQLSRPQEHYDSQAEFAMAYGLDS